MISNEADAREFVRDRIVADDPIAVMTKLDHLADALRDENERQNLVSRGTLNEVWLRHFADSAQLLEHVPRETLSGESGANWLDLGTGAGFPGLVVAALCPQLGVCLVESRRRRVEWLERMIDEMALENCRVEGQRLELVSAFPASIISARAFAPLEKLLRLSARFSTSDTYWVLPKGRKAAQEVQDLPKRMRKMFHVKQSQTSDEAGIIIGRGQF